MDKKIPVYYKKEIIGYTDTNNLDENGVGKIEIKNKELWNEIFISSSSKNVSVSSRSIGKIDEYGNIIEDKKESFEIISLINADKFLQEKENRLWNRCFPKDEIVLLDEDWMDEEEKEKFKDFIGITGIVLNSTSDLHAFGRGSYYFHEIKWLNGIKTNEAEMLPHEESIIRANILESFFVKLICDLEKQFKDHKIEINHELKVLYDKRIVNDTLINLVGCNYKEFLQDIINKINMQYGK